MNKLLIILALYFSVPAHAVRMDLVAHAAVAYAATYTLSDVFHRQFGMKRSHSTLLAGGLVFAAGIYKEFAIDQRPDKNDILANGIGIGSATIMKFAIDF